MVPNILVNDKRSSPVPFGRAAGRMPSMFSSLQRQGDRRRGVFKYISTRLWMLFTRLALTTVLYLSTSVTILMLVQGITDISVQDSFIRFHWVDSWTVCRLDYLFSQQWRCRSYCRVFFSQMVLTKFPFCLANLLYLMVQSVKASAPGPCRVERRRFEPWIYPLRFISTDLLWLYQFSPLLFSLDLPHRTIANWDGQNRITS